MRCLRSYRKLLKSATLRIPIAFLMVPALLCSPQVLAQTEDEGGSLDDKNKSSLRSRPFHLIDFTKFPEMNVEPGSDPGASESINTISPASGVALIRDLTKLREEVNFLLQEIERLSRDVASIRTEIDGMADGRNDFKTAPFWIGE